MKITIYKIENSINGWCYIGSTNNFNSRKSTHLSKLNVNEHHCLLLQKDYNKYKKSDFNISIIESIDEQYRYISEEWYIKKYYPKVYNTLLVPNSQSKESMEKISDSHRTWKLQDMKNILTDLLTNNKSLKETLKSYKITESIFQHTIVCRDRNQHIIDSSLENLIKEYKLNRIKNNGNFKGKRTTGIFFKDSSGSIHEVTHSLNKFAKEHNLSSGGISELKTGKRKQLKGWTLYAD